MSKELQIRNSTAEFLIFQAEDKAHGVQVFYKDETIWASQKAIAALFDVDRSVVTKHLKNIFETGELQQNAVCAKFAHTACCWFREGNARKMAKRGADAPLFSSFCMFFEKTGLSIYIGENSEILDSHY